MAYLNFKNLSFVSLIVMAHLEQFVIGTGYKC